MSGTRERLPNRRQSETFTFSIGPIRYTAIVSRFHDGRLAEIFLNSGKAGSGTDVAAKDSAVVASIALQFGVPVDVIRHALLRDEQDRGATPLGVALDIIAGTS